MSETKLTDKEVICRWMLRPRTIFSGRFGSPVHLTEDPYLPKMRTLCGRTLRVGTDKATCQRCIKLAQKVKEVRNAE